MTNYKAYRHKKTGCVWVPFWKVDKKQPSEIGCGEEATECKMMVTNGVIIRELTHERTLKCTLEEVEKDEFEKAIENLEFYDGRPQKVGDMICKFGCIFTVTALYDLDDEYMKTYDLYCRTRIVENSPTYEYNPVAYGCNKE